MALARTIKLGKKYPVRVEAKTGGETGAQVALDGTYDIKATARSKDGSGEVIDSIDSASDPSDWTFDNGVAVGYFDTSQGNWRTGQFYYDIRIKPNGGDDVWSQTVTLVVEPAQTDPAT